MRIWAVIRRKHKIVAQAVADAAHEGTAWSIDDLYGALQQCCEELDLAHPVVLEKHAKEMTKFGRTVFNKADFIDVVPFDQLEIELLDDKRVKKSVYNKEYE